MCGILFTRGIEENSAKNALKKIKHRGPDAINHIFLNNDFFGHVRLSILDLDERSNQPFFSNDGETLIFNGEIYNYLELKQILINKHKIKFKTTSDTEVLFWILKLDSEYLLNMMNGMWSFVFINKSSEIYFSRDRYGIKPMFLFYSDDKIIISSEISAISTSKCSAMICSTVFILLLSRKLNPTTL